MIKCENCNIVAAAVDDSLCSECREIDESDRAYCDDCGYEIANWRCLCEDCEEVRDISFKEAQEMQYM